MSDLSPDTQATLLLTGQLIAGRADSPVDPMTPGKYALLERALHAMQRTPADLLGPGARDVLAQLRETLDTDLVQRLLERGFLLSQALERWQARSIWVVSRRDPEYPARLKGRFGEAAPAVVYGCGDATMLDTGGLAIVGSRNVDAELLDYTEGLGRLAAESGVTVISGGARGIDQAAMRGALSAGGRVVGVLADSLERAAVAREHRDVLMDGQLVLISVADPAAGFHVGNAMQRNKYIYALSDAAIAVNADYNTGGTWAGAVEQLEKYRFVPIYVRSRGELGKGLEALRAKGAIPWPDPDDANGLAETLSARIKPPSSPSRQDELLFTSVETTESSRVSAESTSSARSAAVIPTPDAYTVARAKVEQLTSPLTEPEVIALIGGTKKCAKEYLKRLVDERILERHTRPIRYQPAQVSDHLC